MDQSGATFNLARVFDEWAENLGDRPCLLWGKRSFSYIDIRRRAWQLASYLHSRGLRIHTERSELSDFESGQDHLAIMAYNSNEYLESMIAGYRARVVPCNVNYRYSGEELSYLFSDANPKGLVFHGEFAPVISQVLSDNGQLGSDRGLSCQVLIQIGDASGQPLLDGAIWYEDAIAAGDPKGPSCEPSPEDLYIIYTGGTTGMPKGVLWRQHDIFLAAMGGRKVGTWDVVSSYRDVRDRALAGAPLGLRLGLLPPFMHGAAQWAAFMLMAQGATIVLPEITNRLDPQSVWEMVEQRHVTSLTFVGDAMIRPLLDEFEKKAAQGSAPDASSLLSIGNGGAPLTPPMRERIGKILPHVSISDSAGSSETGAQMHAIGTANSTHRVGTFTPGPGSVVLDEEKKTVLAPGHEGIGWLAQSGPVPLGYLGDPEKTKATFLLIDGVRYSLPGDRARLLSKNSLELLGRDSLTINSGGEKIFVEEVEGALARHPRVGDVVVAGRPSEKWGEEVAAVIQLAPTTPSTAPLASIDPEDRSALITEIVSTAALSLARYKLPKCVVFVEHIERSPSGKADYRWAKNVVAKN